MPIAGALRDKLEAGTILLARYKGSDHRAEVVMGEDGKRRFRLADGREFKSPSAAGSAVMGGVACNGWRFFSVEDATAGETEDAAAAVALKPTPGRADRPGCSRCGKSFVSTRQLEHHEANVERLCRPA